VSVCEPGMFPEQASACAVTFRKFGVPIQHYVVPRSAVSRA
jgi:hypothetical protein